MSKRVRFSKCYGCSAGYSDYKRCKPAKHRISRKQKKLLKRFIASVSPFMQYEWGYADSCNPRAAWYDTKKLLHLIPFCEKWRNELMMLNGGDEYSSEGIYLDDKGRICWKWEYDNGLYTEIGLMPFCYSKEDEGKTWAYSELHEFFNCLTKGRVERCPEYVKSDLNLLTFIKNNPQ